MKSLLKALGLLVFVFFSYSCTEEEVEPDMVPEEEMEDNMDEGSDDEPAISVVEALVFNEGNFGSANANIGFYSIDAENYNPASFNQANGNQFVGDVLQHALADGDNLYVVLNGSNTIKLLNVNTLVEQDVLEDTRIDKPRYIALDGNYAYLSNWGPFNDNFQLINSNVLKINLSNFSIESTLEVGTYPEQLFVDENYIYVARADFSGEINSVQIINKSTESIEEELQMPSRPDEFFQDEAGSLWISCRGGQLVQINSDELSIAVTVELEESITEDVDVYQNSLYALTNSGKILAYSLDSLTTNTVTAIEASETFKAFGVDPARGEFYVGDFIDFSSEGEVIRVSADGTILDSFVSGVGPTQFIFN